MGRRLSVLVSTQEALRVALSNDLDVLCIYPTLHRELGETLFPTMRAAGFYPEGTEDRRGMVFIRRKKVKP